MSDYSLELIGKIISINERYLEIGEKLRYICEEIKKYMHLSLISYYVNEESLKRFLLISDIETEDYGISEKVCLKGDVELYESHGYSVLNLPVKDSFYIYGLMQIVKRREFKDGEIKLLTLISRQISEYIHFHRVNEAVQNRLEQFVKEKKEYITEKDFLKEDLLNDFLLLISLIFTQTNRTNVLKYISLYLVFNNYFKVDEGIFYLKDKSGNFKAVYHFNKKNIRFIHFQDAVNNINKMENDRETLKKFQPVKHRNELKQLFKNSYIYTMENKKDSMGYFICNRKISEIKLLLKILTVCLNNIEKINTMLKFGESINKVEKRLIEDNITKHYGEIVNQISHEIKNPLVVIAGYANRIMQNIEKCKEPDIEYIKNSCRIIVEESVKLENLLHDSIIYNRASKIEFKRISLYPIIKKCINLFKYQLAERDISLIFNYKNSEKIYGDPVQIRQLFFNLIINSMEAIKNNGKILINLFSGEKYTIFEIEDNGGGIPDNKIQNIFNPFFTTKIKGSGLGLAIVYRIVKSHNGIILVKNLDKGVKFTIKFPFGEKNVKKNSFN